MGYLGFLFQINERSIVVLTQRNEIDKILIIGLLENLPKNIEYYSLREDLNFGEFIFIDETPLVYSKIRANDQKVIDLEFNTFWFEGKTYRVIYDILSLDSYNENTISMKVVELLEYL